MSLPLFAVNPQFDGFGFIFGPGLSKVAEEPFDGDGVATGRRQVVNSELGALRSCGQCDHVVEEIIRRHNIGNIIRLAIDRLKKPSPHQVHKVRKVVKLITEPFMVVERRPQRGHPDNFNRTAHRSILLFDHLDRPLPALAERCEVLLYEGVEGCFGEVFGRLRNVFLGFLELGDVARVL